jgi:glycosyltransferase involved in cell wall biosynthesis
MTAGPTLRILHTEASLGWGGQEIRILTEARRFADSGHAVQLICDPTSDIAAAAPDFGIETETMELKKKSFAALRALRRAIAAWRPDVVNCHSSIDHWLAAAARLGLAPRPAIVRTRHISAPVSRNRPTRWLYNRGCEHVITTSEAMVGELTCDRFLPASRVAAVPTGIDIARFAPGEREAARRALGLPASTFVFGIVATLRSWKGHGVLLDALAALEEGDPMLLVVGDGPQEDNLKARVKALGLGPRVRFTGRREDVAAHLRAMDAFVLPSTANEGVPQALVQAMACALPVIASRIGGVPELVAGLEAAVTVPPGDAHALTEAMRQAMAVPPAPAARAALRRRIEEDYTLDAMYDRVLAVFERAAGRRAAAAER